jgi:hypothetical protein
LRGPGSRAGGIPRYGARGFFYDRDDIRFPGRGERLKVQSFCEGQTFMHNLVKRLSSSLKASSTRPLGLRCQESSHQMLNRVGLSQEHVVSRAFELVDRGPRDAGLELSLLGAAPLLQRVEPSLGYRVRS